MWYVFIIIVAGVLIALAYSLGRERGEKEGINQILNENLIRLKNSTPCADEQMAGIVNNLLSDVDASEQLRSAVMSIEPPTEQPY